MKVELNVVKFENVMEVLDVELFDIEDGEVDYIEDVIRENGSGVYEIIIGSRGEIEEVIKNDEYEEYDDEFYYVEKVNEFVLSVCYSEENSSVFVNVEV